MAGGGGGGGGNKDEPLMIWALGAAVVLGGLWIIWFAAHTPISQAVIWLRFGELTVISAAGHGLESLAAMLGIGHVPPAMTAYLTAIDTKLLPDLKVAHANAFKFRDVVTLSEITGIGLRWPALAIFGWWTWWAATKAPLLKHRVTHSMESLIKNQAKTWRIITPVVSFNPAKANSRTPGAPVPQKLPIFAEALTPEEWVAQNKIQISAIGPDKQALSRAFSAQLGPRWRGARHLQPHAQALFAAFALKAARKRADADRLLGDIAACWSPAHGLRLSGKVKREIHRLIADPKIGGEAEKVAARHAFVTTVLMGLLVHARNRGGVLAPSQFLWVRGIDRSLWYPLNNLGRQVAHAEAAGAISHYMAERMTGKAMPNPKVDAAIAALEKHLTGDAGPIPPLAA